MRQKSFDIEDRQIILHTLGPICTTASELLHSDVFDRVVALYCRKLIRRQSPLAEALAECFTDDGNAGEMTRLLILLADRPLEEAVSDKPRLQGLLEAGRRRCLWEFVEGLYDFWRSFDRFMVLHSEPGKSSFDRRPYRSFNVTIEALTHVVRATYRDICENITGDHPRIYRQVFAGCDVGLIAVPQKTRLPEPYRPLEAIPFIRHVWIAPPMIIDPPTNTRTGQFRRVDKNPLANVTLDKDKWICYPARVGPLTIFVYFHQKRIDLGCSLANLFELAGEEQIARGPDALYCFGVERAALQAFGDFPTVFYDDEENSILTAAIPRDDEFAYFGYLKKMVLTLHNIVMMKRGQMPFHGAMVRIALKDGSRANLVLIGDTGAGKSESLEAFRTLGAEEIRELRIVADDMGSFRIDPEKGLLGYGTETGAFIRLDDLQAGYAFQQIDRAIIMSPQKTNARVVLPVTTLDEVLHGYPVDFILYANNYEQVNEDHPVIERFSDPEQALAVFREGASMAKGTTTATGLGHNYFANIFGPPQYRPLHEELARRIFEEAYRRNVFVGQIRTRLGIPGFEQSGPEIAAKALLEAIRTRKR